MEPTSVEDIQIEQWIDKILNKYKQYSRTLIPAEEITKKEIEQNTRRIIIELLGKILSSGDSAYHHKKLDYSIFLPIQIEILNHTLFSERNIQSLRREHPNSYRAILLKKRRNMLKLLGSTIAWILLEFDVPYIRNLSRSHDSGYLIGKKGLIGELYSLVTNDDQKNHAAILHGITHCLKAADITLTDGDIHAPIEIKLVKTHRKLDRRERRQQRRLGILKEFYENKKSTRLYPGRIAVRHDVKEKDIHNWERFTEVVKVALKEGYAIDFPEEGIAYGVCQNPKQFENIALKLKDTWSEPLVTFGSLDRHINGLPEIMPFTLFEIPQEVKESIMFGDLMVLNFVDLKAICKTYQRMGLKAWLEHGVIHLDKDGTTMVMGSHYIDRLLYEFLSMTTVCRYTQHVYKTAIDDLVRS